MQSSVTTGLGVAVDDPSPSAVLDSLTLLYSSMGFGCTLPASS